MKVTPQDVHYVAELANLELTEQERGRMVADLNSILEYIDRLNQLNTGDVPPMAQVFGGGAAFPWREDELRPSLPRSEVMKGAPGSDGEFFKVPKVIER